MIRIQSQSAKLTLIMPEQQHSTQNATDKEIHPAVAVPHFSNLRWRYGSVRFHSPSSLPIFRDSSEVYQRTECILRSWEHPCRPPRLGHPCAQNPSTWRFIQSTQHSNPTLYGQNASGGHLLAHGISQINAPLTTLGPFSSSIPAATQQLLHPHHPSSLTDSEANTPCPLASKVDLKSKSHTLKYSSFSCTQKT